MSTRKDGDRSGSKSGFEPLGQIHGVRRFSSAAQLEVAHNQRRQGAAFAVQEAPVISLVSKPKRGRVQRRQREEPRTQPCVSLARLARRERV